MAVSRPPGPPAGEPLPRHRALEAAARRAGGPGGTAGGPGCRGRAPSQPKAARRRTESPSMAGRARPGPAGHRRLRRRPPGTRFPCTSLCRGVFIGLGFSDRGMYLSVGFRLRSGRMTVSISHLGPPPISPAPVPPSGPLRSCAAFPCCPGVLPNKQTDK